MSRPPFRCRMAASLAVLLLGLPHRGFAADPQPGPASGIFPAADHDPLRRNGPLWDDSCRFQDGSFLTLRQQGSNLVVQRFDSLGNRRGKPIQPNTDPTRGNSHLACNDRGDFVVAWWEEYERYRLRVYSRDGEALSPVTFATAEEDPAASGAEFMRMAISPDRIVVATFDPLYYDDGMSVVVHAADGTLLGSHETFLSYVYYADSALAFDGAGSALVYSWGKLRALTDLQTGGRPLGEEFAVPGTDGAPARLNTIEPLAPGVFLALWYEDKTGLLGTIVTLDGKAAAMPPVAETSVDPLFTRAAVAGGPRPDELGEKNWEPSRGRPWPSPPRIATGDRAWVMARVHPTWRGAGWGSGYEDVSFDVVLQRSTDGGRTWGARKTLWQPGAFNSAGAGAPDVAGDGQGHFVVVSFNSLWSPLPYAVQLQVTTSSDDGNSWSGPVEIYRDSASEVDGVPSVGPARIATDGGGTWLAVWGETEWYYEQQRIGYSIYVSRSVDDGATWSAAKSIAEDQGYGSRGLDVEWDGQGRWVVAWNDEVLRTATSPDAASWSDPTTLTSLDVPTAMLAILSPGRSSSFISRDVSLAAGEDGRVLLVASSHAVDAGVFGYDDDIFSWILEPGVRHWSTPRVVNSSARADGTNDAAPIAGSDGNGGWIVAWHAVPGGALGLDGDILLSRSRTGRSWDAATTVAAMDGDDSGSDWPGDLVTSGGVSLLSWATSGDEWAAGVRIAGDSCGNGTRDEGEACDDGNTSDGDSCNRNCSLPRCGNGALDPGEGCDDANADDDDACPSLCRPASCGDGFRRLGVEQCDDGNDSSLDSCTGDCRIATCGDGFVHEGVEECDDGNWTDNDGCLSCQLARCGDRALQVGVEECDDGNTANGDFCTDKCRVPRCGDGVVSTTEECDPVGTGSSDYCTSDCRIANCPDADGSGSVTTADAMRILSRAVGFDVSCPPFTCDANSNHRIDVSDARLVLRFAVGIETGPICDHGGEVPPADAVVSFSVSDARLLGRLQVTVRYGSSKDLFNPFGPSAHPCTTDIPGATAEFTTEEGRLDATIVAPAGVSGTTEMFHCSWYGGASPSPDGFSATVKDAASPGGEDFRPLPKVDIAVQ